MTTSKFADGPFDFARNLWEKMGGELPGMISPTTDIDELERRVADLKAVESWLKMNLTMLQLSIQGLDMQCSTLKAVRELASRRPELMATASPAAGVAKKNTPKESNQPIQPEDSFQMLWPWALMQEIQERMQGTIEQPAPTPPKKTPAKAAKTSRKAS